MAAGSEGIVFGRSRIGLNSQERGRWALLPVEVVEFEDIGDGSWAQKAILRLSKAAGHAGGLGCG